MTKNKPRILLWDCETSYTVGATWGLYEQNVVTVLRDPYMISFAWKWLGESKTHVVSLPDFPLYKKDKRSDRQLIEQLRGLFDEADVIVAHNGNSFDQKWAYSRFMVHSLTPPSPSKYVDTKVIAKSKGRFNSNSLDNLGKYFNCGQKLSTGGIDLWVGCIERDEKKSWKTMCDYNKQDVVLLEQVYLKLLPYMTNHPNLGILLGKRSICPNCSSKNLQSRGSSYGKRKWFCIDCRSWHTSSFKEEAQIR